MIIIEQALSIHRLAPDSKIPGQTCACDFYSITKTEEEISVKCSSSFKLQCEATSAGWLGLKVAGPLDFALTGILADITAALARANISIFALSTFDTDYILVKAEKISQAVDLLRNAGHTMKHV